MTPKIQYRIHFENQEEFVKSCRARFVVKDKTYLMISCSKGQKGVKIISIYLKKKRVSKVSLTQSCLILCFATGDINKMKIDYVIRDFKGNIIRNFDALYLLSEKYLVTR